MPIWPPPSKPQASISPGRWPGYASRPGRRRGGGGARRDPHRAVWYAEPFKVFDNLYWLGTKVHSSWALTDQDGIIIIDTLYDYAIEPEIIDGLKKMHLDPKDVKYVIVSHGHGDHDEGAKMLQDRGAPMW